MRTQSEICSYCQEQRVDGEPHGLFLRHQVTKQKKQIPIARCGPCQQTHRVASTVFLVTWLLMGVAPAVFVFWSWFQSIDGGPRGFRGLILVSAVLASLPGLGLGVLARNLVYKSRKVRAPRDVEGLPAIQAASRDGWVVAR